MDQDLKNRIDLYINKELFEIGKPKKPSREQVHVFKDLNIIIDLLFKLLDTKVKEPSIQRVGGNFYNHLPKILDFKEKELPNSIEGLATNFESFLKLIAYLKYGETEVWAGDTLYSDGLIKTTLHNLSLGVINNKFSAPQDIPLSAIPEPLIEYKGIQRNIIDFIRTDLRNAVHDARNYSRMELMHYSNIVLSGYLIAVEDNLMYLKKKFLNEYLYLEKVVQDTEYKNLDKVYVELLGQESLKEIEVLGAEIIDEHELTSAIQGYNLDNEEGNNIQFTEKRIDSIVKIAMDTPMFQIIGKPGSGKSTTLLKILYNNAIDILNGNNRLKVPFFINANEYRPQNSFLDILSKRLNTDWILENLKKGNVRLLIDGLNEITERYKLEAYREIGFFLKDYPDISIILSERKLNFERRFDLPVFELKDLNELQIRSFIKNYSNEYADKIWMQLQKNEYMLQLAYNPLMLKMILCVSKNGIIPLNRGLLLQTFINSIFHREKTKFVQISIDTKIDVSAFVSFNMRTNGDVSLPISKFKNLIATYSKSNNIIVGVNQLYNELLDNLIIKVSQNEEVSFLHETYQEYFCAIEVKNKFEIYNTLDININDKSWFEVLLISSELFKDEKRVKAYFEFIFTGSTKRSIKRLKDFSIEDTNRSIVVGCKIAYELKYIRPEIYLLAEQYLFNYLRLWKYIFYYRNLKILPLDVLFSSISSLNSEKIIYYVINNFGWVNIWLAGAKKEAVKDTIGLIREEDSEIVIKIYEAICQNTPNFTSFYNIVNDSLTMWHFSKDVFSTLKNLKIRLLRSQQENQLKKYFENVKDFDVFYEIIKSDIDFISSYDFKKYSEYYNEQILRLLINYHIRSELAQSIIFREIFTFKYHKELFENVARSLYYVNQYTSLYVLMEFLYENDIKSYENNVCFIQNIPYDQLSDKLKSAFFKKGKRIEIPLESIHPNMLLIKKEYMGLISPKCFYIINQISRIKTNAVIPVTRHQNYNLVLEHNYAIQLFDYIPRNGIIKMAYDNKQFHVRYDGFSFTIKPYRVMFNIIDHLKTEELSGKRKVINVAVNEVGNWNFQRYDFETIEDKQFAQINYENIDKNITQIEINQKIAIDFSFDPLICLSRPYLNHADLIKNEPEIINYLASNLEEPDHLAFINKCGLRHLFNKYFTNSNYAIIMDIYDNIVKVFSMSEQMFSEFKVPKEILSSYQIHKIVVIEANKTIPILKGFDENRDHVGYIKSEIVYIDPNRKEGFIKINSKNYANDYFFRFENCNFSPEIGDQVRFIPALNPLKNNLNKPIALRINKI